MTSDELQAALEKVLKEWHERHDGHPKPPDVHIYVELEGDDDYDQATKNRIDGILDDMAKADRESELKVKNVVRLYLDTRDRTDVQGRYLNHAAANAANKHGVPLR